MKKFFTDKRIEILIRFWAAGALFYFIGWGTGLGLGSTLDFILVLGVFMGLIEMLIVNPIVRHMLNVKSNKKYLDTTILDKVKNRLIVIFKNIFIMLIIEALYNIINKSFIILGNLPDETIVLPGEPILFGIFYLIIYELIKAITNNVHNKMKDVKENVK